MKRRGAFETRAGFLACMGLAAGCGGNVVFDETGVEGGDAPSSSSTGVPDDGVCQRFCDAEARACGETATCVDDCTTLRSYSGRCDPEVVARMACAVEAGLTCGDLPEVCLPQDQAREDCWFPPGGCGERRCSFQAESVVCEVDCGPRRFTTACVAATLDQRAVSCTCTVDGEPIATCVDELSALGTCCATVFTEL